MPTRFTIDDLMTGLFASLASKGETAISVRDRAFDEALGAVFEKLTELSSDYDLDIRFRIRPSRVHGESDTTRDGIAGAAHQDVISWDNPEYQDVRLKLMSDRAESLLSGGKVSADLFDKLADVFRSAYWSSAVS